MYEYNQSQDSKPQYFTPVTGAYIGKITGCEVRVYHDGQPNELYKLRFSFVPVKFKVKGGKWVAPNAENPVVFFELFQAKGKRDRGFYQMADIMQIAGVTHAVPQDGVVKHLNGDSHPGKVIKELEGAEVCIVIQRAEYWPRLGNQTEPRMQNHLKGVFYPTTGCTVNETKAGITGAVELNRLLTTLEPVKKGKKAAPAPTDGTHTNEGTKPAAPQASQLPDEDVPF